MLLGDEAMSRIAEKRVIIFGVGGVGSWCAESLVRSGIRKLTIVDSDCVSVTNINRQLMATTKTVGQVGSRSWKCSAKCSTTSTTNNWPSNPHRSAPAAPLVPTSNCALYN